MTTMLQQRINSITGKCEWVLISGDQQEGCDRKTEDDAVSQALVDTSYLDMLNDTRRNKAFHSGIRKLLNNPSFHHVLDIGAGTGLLSMMAHRTMTLRADTMTVGKPTDVTVTACESYLPMYQLARSVLRQNNMESGIKLFNMRSDEMEVGVQLPSRADALVCEILDSELLGEGVIPTLRHAHQHLLKEDAGVVPYRATVYAQLVESDSLWRCHDLKGVETEVNDAMVLAPPGYEESSYCKFSNHAMHVDELPDVKKLSEPFEAFSVEFHRAPEPHGFFKRSVHISRDGVAHAVVSWWVLQLDKEGLIHYSTAPKWLLNSATNSNSGTRERSWSDHWRQCVWFLPGRGIPVKANSCKELVVKHDEISVQYELGQPWPEAKPLLSPALKMTPNRIRMLGSPKRRSIVRDAIAKAVGDKNSTCLIVDDSLLAAVVASKQSSKVYAMFPGYKYEGIKYLNTIADANGFDSGKISLLSKKLEELTVDDLKKVDVVVAEPYYCNYENMLPWKQLRFWHDLSRLRPLLPLDCKVLPCRGTLRGMGFSLPDLWESRCSLKKVEGFDHTPANRFLGACGNLPEPLQSPILSFPLWQCGEHQALTDPFTLMTFDFSKEFEDVYGTAKVHLSKTGLCHGIVVWMDWVMDSEDMATDPSDSTQGFLKQGIHLLKTPIEMADLNSYMHVEATFVSITGELQLKVAL